MPGFWHNHTYMHRRDLFGLVGVPLLAGARNSVRDPRMRGAARTRAEKGWIAVRLEGAPFDLGYQHGTLLSAEIADTHRAVVRGLIHDSKPYDFFRRTAAEMFWPKVTPEYQAELNGMAAALKDRGVALDVTDLVVLNASLELPYYVNTLKNAQKQPIPERCSAFVATGSYTRDGQFVIGHNCWTDYMSGSRWNIIFDVKPEKGHAFLMDGLPGLIHSGDDFGVTSAGLVITETTISQFNGFDVNGVPEFVRARRAMQYASSIDDFADIMKEGNNGGYANNWLVADRKTNEIASLELGLKNVILERTRDGYFVGANFPVNAKLMAEETDFNPKDKSVSANARRVRWEQLMAENRGRIDVEAGQRFLADHYDSFDEKVQPGERTLCGHVDLSPRGLKPWAEEFAPCGAVQNKVTDAALAEKMSMTALFGHACGLRFKADEHLRKNPQFAWQKGVLRDIPAYGWAKFTAAG